MDISNYLAGSKIKEASNSKKALNNDSNNGKNNQLSVDDFLKIMAAEIQNQSPVGADGGGGSKTDYISQLAQFTTLEELSSISESIGALTMMTQQQHAFNLIGKEVTVHGEEEINGLVDKVKFQNGFAIVEVEGKDYHLSQISEVRKEGIKDEL